MNASMFRTVGTMLDSAAFANCVGRHAGVTYFFMLACPVGVVVILAPPSAEYVCEEAYWGVICLRGVWDTECRRESEPGVRR